MAEIWATALGAASAAVGIASAGLSASGALNPSQPNLASSNQQVSDAEASMLPGERQLLAAAQTGSAYSIPLTVKQQKQQTKLNNQISTLQSEISNPASASAHGSAANPQLLQSQLSKAQTKLAGIKQESGTFAGSGANEVQGQIAQQSAKDQLALEQQYSPQFISEALKDEALADPQSVAARGLENDLIQKQINQPITNPISYTLENQVGARVNAGKGLDDFDTGVLNNSVSQALAARGGSSTPGDFTSPLTTGSAGVQRQQQGIAQGQSFLGSGTTPEDVQYRQQQQNLADLSAEVTGATPTSEFGSLSNASKSANPTSNGMALPTLGNTLQTAGNAALTTQQQQAGQSNNWLAGLSAVTGLAGAAGNVQSEIASA